MKNTISQFEAAGLAFAGYTMWVFADTCLKVAGHTGLPAYEILAMVGLAIVAVLVLRGLWRQELRSLWPKRPARQVVRSFLDLANNFGVVIAIRHLPLALFYILVFFSPMLTTLLAAIFLGETLHWKRALAIVVGFAGVLVAVNPLGVTRPGNWTGYLACMVCVACFSANMVWSRVMVRTETPESLTFTSASVMALVGGAAMLLHHAAPVSLKLSGVFLLSGLVCVVGNICFFVALKHTSASNVSQFHYSQLLIGALIAYLIWHEKPTTSMWIGAVLIVGAGLYTAASSYNARAEIEATARSL